MAKFKKSLTPTRTQNLSRSLDEMNRGIERKESTISMLENDISDLRRKKTEADMTLAARMNEVAEQQAKLDVVMSQQKKATAN